MISDDQDNFRETLLFHRSEFLFLQRKQIAFPIDLSPGLDLFWFLIIRRYAVPKD